MAVMYSTRSLTLSIRYLQRHVTHHPGCVVLLFLETTKTIIEEILPAVSGRLNVDLKSHIYGTPLTDNCKVKLSIVKTTDSRWNLEHYKCGSQDL